MSTTQTVTVQHLPQWARNPGHPWIVSAPGSAKAYQTKPDAERAAALAAVLSAAHGVCDQSNDAPPTALEGWPGSPAPELPTPLQIEVANLRRQLRDTQDDLQRARYSPAEHWT